MPKYKLANGHEFDVAPIPLSDDRAGQLLEYIMTLEKSGGEEVGLQWGRDSLIKILGICCPDALPHVTLADVVTFIPQIKDLVNDAWGKEMVPATGGTESKKA